MEEGVVEAKFLEAGALTTACADLYMQVLCGQCHSFSAHLFEQLGSELGAWDGMSMKQDFCDDLVNACGDEIAFGGPADYDGLSYCEKHVGSTGGDLFWSYPYSDPLIVPGELTELFPNIDGSQDFPAQVISMRQSPDASMYWIVGLEGQVSRVQANNMDEIFDVVDISDGDLRVTYEEGLFDVAFDPNWSDNSLFYLSHSVFVGAFASDGIRLANNRISRFTYTAGNTITTRNSELILLTTEAKESTIHSAGWLGFKPSDYGQGNLYNDLYWSVGDGGPAEDPFNNAQDLTNLLGTMIRISVPSFEGAAQLYQIPSGNYQDVDSSAFPEVCAIGLRNPWRCSFDRLNDNLWCGDVGQSALEEVDIIECGNNYGWSRFEGNSCQTAVENNEFNPPCSEADRSPFEFPIYEYCHLAFTSTTDLYTGGVDVCGDREIVGNAIIGGFVYRGSYFSDLLAGAYIFADQVTRFVYFIKQNDEGVWMGGTIISEENDIFVSFSEDVNGELYLITMGHIYHLPCGDLCSSTCLEQNEQQPSIESLGCFADEAGNRALQLYTAETCSTGESYMSPLICASHCSTIAGAVYAGVEDGTDCYCGAAGENFGKNGELGEESCATLCDSDPEWTCGGVNAIEVFQIGSAMVPITPAPGIAGPSPTSTTPAATPAPAMDTPVVTVVTPAEGSLGCFQDALDPRIFPANQPSSVTDMSAAFCMVSCDGQGFDYYGTQYGRECWCGSGTPEDTYELYGQLDDGACDMGCTGIATEACGGFLAMSVYAY